MDPYNPYQQPNPYAPPSPHSEVPLVDEGDQDQGSFWLGFFATLVFALIGLIVVYIKGKPETKRGAGIGFVVRIGLSILTFILL